MTVALTKDYAGRTSGAVASFSTNIEAALIAQGMAATSAAALTTGAYTQNTTSGRASIAIGASSIVITNSLVDVNTKVCAVVAQAAADVTLLRVERVLAAAGSFTIFGTANATAATLVDWWVPLTQGDTGVN